MGMEELLLHPLYTERDLAGAEREQINQKSEILQAFLKMMKLMAAKLIDFQLVFRDHMIMSVANT